MMIRRVNPKNYRIPQSGNLMLHRNLAWYATSDDSVLGVVVLDKIDKDYSWVVLKDSGKGFCAEDLGHSLATVDQATKALHASMTAHRRTTT